MIGIGLAAILVLGVAAQWLAWRLKLPSILLLLLFGFAAGPGAYWFGTSVLGQGATAPVAEAAKSVAAEGQSPGEVGHAPELFAGDAADASNADDGHGGGHSGPLYLNIDGPGGLIGEELLLGLVSIAVGLILFEGGLTLNFGEIKSVRRGVLSLVTVGALVTWVIAGLAAYYVLQLNWSIALLLGAILTVTGPTVIGPLLRFIRPTGSVGKVLKWEGIVIDPIGALLAVLVFEAIRAGHGVGSVESGIATGSEFALGALKASVIGSVLGLAAAAGLVVMLRRFLIPDHLQVPVSLAFAAAAFSGSNYFVHESGLFATTVMGIAMANQKKARIAHIVEFKETLTILLIAMLFIALSARLKLSDLTQLNFLAAAGFLAILIFIARPAAVFISLIGTKLTWREKLFLSWMAPRGIVAAAVASVFGLSLRGEVEGAELLVPYIFLTIVVTVAVYGLTATAVARRLGLANPENAGFIVVGATDVARAVAQAIHDEKIEVLVVDLNYNNVQKARLAGLPSMVANILSPQVQERIELSGIGRLIALTPNNEINSLACVHYARHFGRSNVFQVAHHSQRVQQKAQAKGESGRKKTDVDEEVRGRVAFGHNATIDELDERLALGAKVRKTKLTKEFTFKDWQSRHGRDAVALFVVDEDGSLTVIAADKAISPKAGETIISMSLARSEAVASLLSGPGENGEADRSELADAPDPTEVEEEPANVGPTSPVPGRATV